MSLKSSNKVETNRYELEISIDGAAFQEAVQKAYRKNVKKMNIPGFRKGHAPRSIIEKYYGEQVFYEDALNIVYPDAVEAAVEEAGLELVGDKIDTDVTSIGKEGVELKITVTVKPEVEVGEYKGLKAERPNTSVSDEEIQAELNKLAERNSRMITVEDRAAEKGDVAVIDFEGFVDGEAFEGGKGESYSLTLGSGQFIPGFEEQVVGHKTDDAFDINVTFPEDYHAEQLKGKEAVFKVKLHEIKMRELPEMDDEFAKDVSEFDTLDELKEDTKKKLAERKEKEADDGVETQLVDQLAEGLKAEIPEAMFERRVDENLRDFDYRLQSQGMNLELYMQYTGSSVEEFRKNFRPQAERQVKVRLALEKIAELEKIEPTAEELEAEYKKLSESYGVDVDRVKSAVPEKEVAKDLAVSKAVELVKESAKITAKKAGKTAKAAKSGEDKPKTKAKTAAKTTTRKRTTKKAEEAKTEE
ncbi:MAG: trigger factor [Clostridiales bacterium]|nr:trigger factor [Clostridiales bacterium]